ncbi:MAG: hypothetical protein LBK82_02170 [Planctomycetaceae bacterium]|jgi:hypothetical protein|nr:hypothetical protein [Planctomycetaceae bacterium]
MKTLNDKGQFDQVVKRALERDRITARKMFAESGIAQMKEKEKEKKCATASEMRHSIGTQTTQIGQRNTDEISQNPKNKQG